MIELLFKIIDLFLIHSYKHVETGDKFHWHILLESLLYLVKKVLDATQVHELWLFNFVRVIYFEFCLDFLSDIKLTIIFSMCEISNVPNMKINEWKQIKLQNCQYNLTTGSIFISAIKYIMHK